MTPHGVGRLMTLLGVLLIGGKASSQDRPRVRELGVSPGVLPPGKWNAITDVAGVRAGHKTLVEGDSIRTAVTAILRHGGSRMEGRDRDLVASSSLQARRLHRRRARPIQLRRNPRD